jgi:hypothetical protein
MIALNAPTWLVVVLFILATYRTTRLLTFDHLPVIAVPRVWITNQLDPSPAWRELHPDARPFADRLAAAVTWLTGRGLVGRLVALPVRLVAFTGRTIAYGMECDWCLSVWVAAGGIWLWWEQPVLAQWVFLLAAASGVTGLIAGRDGRHNP